MESGKENNPILGNPGAMHLRNGSCGIDQSVEGVSSKSANDFGTDQSDLTNKKGVAG